MKNEKPILFSGEMVRAILEGKTQTRRIIKPQPKPAKDWDWEWKKNKSKSTSSICWRNDTSPKGLLYYCTYGKVGTILLVKEYHYLFGKWTRNGVTKTGKQKWKFLCDKRYGVKYSDNPPSIIYKLKTDGPGWYKRSPLFMPLWAVRLKCEIKNIQVERLQDITEDDAKAEGVKPYTAPAEIPVYKPAFADLWNRINEERGFGWETNPFVWVIEFEKL